MGHGGTGLLFPDPGFLHFQKPTQASSQARDENTVSQLACLFLSSGSIDRELCVVLIEQPLFKHAAELSLNTALGMRKDGTLTPVRPRIVGLCESTGQIKGHEETLGNLQEPF